MNNNSHPKSNRTKASTQDILGHIKRSPVINSKWRAQYENLLALREHVHRRKGDLVDAAKEEQPVYSLHMADAGTDQYDQDFALSMISNEQSALYEIEEALNRIRSGSYGICEVTGRPIEPERLEAIPWTRFSIEAQQELERQGVVGRAKLAARATLGNESAEDEESDEDES